MLRRPNAVDLSIIRDVCPGRVAPQGVFGHGQKDRLLRQKESVLFVRARSTVRLPLQLNEGRLERVRLAP